MGFFCIRSVIKFLVGLLVLFTLPLTAFAQDKKPKYNPVIIVERMVLYEGIDNNLSFNNRDTSFNWEFTSNNGTIKVWGGNQLLIHPLNLKKTIISVTGEVNGERIPVAEAHFRVMPIPQPTIRIQANNDSVSKAYLLSLKQFNCYIPDFQYNIEYTIKFFKLQVFRNNELLATHENSEEFFAPELNTLFGKLSKGDLIVITNVKAERKDKSGEVAVKPTAFIIK